MVKLFNFTPKKIGKQESILTPFETLGKQLENKRTTLVLLERSKIPIPIRAEVMRLKSEHSKLLEDFSRSRQGMQYLHKVPIDSIPDTADIARRVTKYLLKHDRFMNDVSAHISSDLGILKNKAIK